MTVKNLEKKLKLTKEHYDRIKKAVADVEKNTNGEIALALTPESSDYSMQELFWSIVVGLAVFSGMIPFAKQIYTWLSSIFWVEPLWLLPLFYGLVTFAVIVLCYCISNIPVIDRLIVPKQIRSLKVQNRAMRYFTESGVYATKDHSGILIFVSWVEREVRIVADKGICEKVPQIVWDDIALTVSKGFLVGKASTITDSFVEAIVKCGKILIENFPAKKENPNEIEDDLEIVDNGLVVFNE